MAAGEKIKVIIVDDIAETRENIRKLLQFESGIEVVGVARTGKEGLELAKEAKPDVILMDINMPDMDGLQATEAVRKILHYVQIVILSVQNDANYMRRALLAGANDFLAKPPTVDELTAAIRRAGAKSHEEKAKFGQVFIPQQGVVAPAVMAQARGMNGRVIVVYSPKGGTGCTTIATNLAISLTNEETPTALVDGNLYFGDVAIFLNEQSKYSVADLAPRVDELDADIINNVLIKHNTSGVRVLPAPFRPEYAENVTGEQFSKVLKTLKRFFSYIVVDTTSALTDTTLGAIVDASDVIVLITTQDIPAIKSSKLFLDLADALDISRKKILFVMNRYDKRLGITAEKIGENFKQNIVESIPFDDRTVVPSINHGVPFILGDKARPISRSILNLAEAVRHRLLELEAEAPARN